MQPFTKYNKRPGVRLKLSILRKLSGLSWVLLGRSNSLKPVVAGPRKPRGYGNAHPSDSDWEADVLPLNYTRKSGSYVSLGLSHEWNWWRLRIFYHLPGDFGRRRIRTRGVEKTDFHDRARPEDNAFPAHQGAGHWCACGGEAA